MLPKMRPYLEVRDELEARGFYYNRTFHFGTSRNPGHKFIEEWTHKDGQQKFLVYIYTGQLVRVYKPVEEL